MNYFGSVFEFRFNYVVVIESIVFELSDDVMVIILSMEVLMIMVKYFVNKI